MDKDVHAHPPPNPCGLLLHLPSWSQEHQHEPRRRALRHKARFTFAKPRFSFCRVPTHCFCNPLDKIQKCHRLCSGQNMCDHSLILSNVNLAPVTRPAPALRGTEPPEITPPSSSPTWPARWSTLTCTARCRPCTRRSTGPGTPPSLSRPRSSRGSGGRSWPSQERIRALR